MSTISISRHAEERSAQRGIPINDLEILMLIGCEVEDGYFVRDKDCEVVERELLYALKRIRRLRGTRMVVANGCAVTAYRPDRRQEQRLLRKAQERELTFKG